jgi:hypothetical protein
LPIWVFIAGGVGALVLVVGIAVTIIAMSSGGDDESSPSTPAKKKTPVRRSNPSGRDTSSTNTGDGRWARLKLPEQEPRASLQ